MCDKLFWSLLAEFQESAYTCLNFSVPDAYNFCVTVNTFQPLQYIFLEFCFQTYFWTFFWIFLVSELMLPHQACNPYDLLPQFIHNISELFSSLSLPTTCWGEVVVDTTSGPRTVCMDSVWYGFFSTTCDAWMAGFSYKLSVTMLVYEINHFLLNAPLSSFSYFGKLSKTLIHWE